MSELVTLELSDVLVRSARAIAEQTQRRFEDVLIEWLDRAATDMPVELLPDDQVIALRDMQMSEVQQEELSELLALQREGMIDSPGRVRLQELLEIYQRGMILKAHALKVAVDRGLQLPGSA